jgi:hypothetical protein
MVGEDHYVVVSYHSVELVYHYVLHNSNYHNGGLSTIMISREPPNGSYVPT